MVYYRGTTLCDERRKKYEPTAKSHARPDAHSHKCGVYHSLLIYFSSLFIGRLLHSPAFRGISRRRSALSEAKYYVDSCIYNPRAYRRSRFRRLSRRNFCAFRCHGRISHRIYYCDADNIAFREIFRQQKVGHSTLYAALASRMLYRGSALVSRRFPRVRFLGGAERGALGVRYPLYSPRPRKAPSGILSFGAAGKSAS